MLEKREANLINGTLNNHTPFGADWPFDADRCLAPNAKPDRRLCQLHYPVIFDPPESIVQPGCAFLKSAVLPVHRSEQPRATQKERKMNNADSAHAQTQTHMHKRKRTTQTQTHMRNTEREKNTGLGCEREHSGEK